MSTVSVVIPTLNGGDLLVAVIRSVMTQNADFDYELVVIDSGSSDGTLDFLRAESQTSVLKLVEIEQSSFGHGKTRNLAVELTNSEFVAFITQDALPANSLWLRSLVAPFYTNETIAGCFGRHIAYPTASIKTKADLESFMAGFDKGPEVLNIKSLPQYSTDESIRQFAHFYSDNNSCLRRSVWSKIPCPDVEYGEDQIWARQILESGYSKAYASEAIVYHSHEYGIVEQYQRSRIDRRFWVTHFAYTSVMSYQSAVSLTFSEFRACSNWHKLKNSPLSLRAHCKTFLTTLARCLGEYHGYRDALKAYSRTKPTV